MLPSAETAAMLFWARLAASQTILRTVDGWQTLGEALALVLLLLTSPPDPANYQFVGQFVGNTPLKLPSRNSRRHRRRSQECPPVSPAR